MSCEYCNARVDDECRMFPPLPLKEGRLGQYPIVRAKLIVNGIFTKYQFNQACRQFGYDPGKYREDGNDEVRDDQKSN